MPAAPTRERSGTSWAEVLLRWSNVAVIILLFAISSLLSRYFLTVRNIMNSHNLLHVFRVADRIAVLYHGELVSVIPKAEADPQRIVALMMGRSEGGEVKSALDASRDA